MTGTAKSPDDEVAEDAEVVEAEILDDPADNSGAEGDTVAEIEPTHLEPAASASPRQSSDAAPVSAVFVFRFGPAAPQNHNPHSSSPSAHS